MKHDEPDHGTDFASMGKAPKIGGQCFVVVYDEKTGQVISRSMHTWLEGGKPPDEKAAAKQAIAQVERFYETLTSDRDGKHMKASQNLKLCPVSQLKTVMIEDISLMDADLSIDPKTQKACIADRGAKAS